MLAFLFFLEEVESIYLPTYLGKVRSGQNELTE